MPDDSPNRTPLNRERVLRAAVEVADRDGLEALTMRRLGAELGVEAMSLYRHVANKDAILDGIVEVVIGEIDVPRTGSDWKDVMRRRAASAREVLKRHSWAIGLLESRTAMGPTAMAYVDAVLGRLRAAGFSVRDAAHAFWLLDSYVYGHVVQETSMPVSTSDEITASAAATLGRTSADEHPHLVEVEEHALGSEFSFDDEFAFGLELILDALDRLVEPGS